MRSQVFSVRLGLWLLGLLVLGSGRAVAVDLYVDFGVADNDSFTSFTPNEVQAGYSGFSIQPDFNGGPQQDTRVVFPQITTTQNISGVDVSVHGGGNGLIAYDFVSEVNHALGNLLEDGLQTVDADLTVTLSGLPAGIYAVTGYHHFASPPPSFPLPFPGFDIYANTGSGESLVVNDVVTSTGLNPQTITTSNFQIVASGANIVLRLDGEFLQASPSIPVFLNGLAVVAVPEPSSVVLLALGAIALIWQRWRRG